MTTPLRVDLVDLSNWQDGTYNFGAASRAGVQGIYHKATESTNYHDPNYPRRRGEVNGLFGAYHFARPAASSGKAQAQYFLAYARPKDGDLTPMLDLEDNGGKGKIALTLWVRAFVREVKRQTGTPPIIYTHFDLVRNFNCALWVASYANDNRQPHVPRPWKTWTFWQFSDGRYGVPNKIDGIGNVDLSTANTHDPKGLLDKFVIGAGRERKAPPPTLVTHARGFLHVAKERLKKHGPRFKRIAKALRILPKR